jgi:hypothetical protein
MSDTPLTRHGLLREDYSTRSGGRNCRCGYHWSSGNLHTYRNTMAPPLTGVDFCIVGPGTRLQTMFQGVSEQSLCSQETQAEQLTDT